MVSRRCSGMNCKFIVLIFAFALVACSTQRSVMSFSDRSYFKEPPKIVTKGDKYYLRFVYTDQGSFAYFMMTESRVKEDRVIFFIPSTTSSGKKHGEVQYEAIENNEKIRLIREKRAFWVNPDETTVTLRVEPLDEEDFNEWGRGNIIVRH
jgi:hypothetical protein